MSAFGAKRTGKKRFVMSASLTHSGSRVPRFAVGAQSRRAPAVLRAAEWGSAHHFAWQQSQGLNVRFGSKADIHPHSTDVRFTPIADIETQPRNVRYVPKAEVIVGHLIFGSD